MCLSPSCFPKTHRDFKNCDFRCAFFLPASYKHIGFSKSSISDVSLTLILPICTSKIPKTQFPMFFLRSRNTQLSTCDVTGKPPWKRRLIFFKYSFRCLHSVVFLSAAFISQPLSPAVCLIISSTTIS